MTSLLRPIWLQVQNLQGELGVVLQENLSGMRVVKAFGREELREREVQHARRRSSSTNSYATNRIQAHVLADDQRHLGCSRWSRRPGSARNQILNGDLTAGELAQFLLYLTMLQMPVRSLGFITMLWARAGTSGQRIYEILDAESAVQEKPNAVELAGVTGPRALRGRLVRLRRDQPGAAGRRHRRAARARSSRCSARPAAARRPSST